MHLIRQVVFNAALPLLLLFSLTAAPCASAAGQASCAECHEAYCTTWRESGHGRSLQPYTPEIAEMLEAAQSRAIAIGTFRYTFKANDQNGWIEEKTDSSTSSYQIHWLLGGKNILSFLTVMDRGRLQVLPLAYDMKKKAWFDNSAMLPHGRPAPSRSWKSRAGTFGTACFSCHADSTASFYNPQSDSYAPLGERVGISCSSCHGATDAHERAARTAGASGPPAGDTMFRFTSAGPDQVNSICGACHAARVPLTAAFIPGSDFFDHFDLRGLESGAFYPDGSGRGDTRVFTQWRMSSCVRSGGLHCLHCHTQGGAYRFTDPARANDACLPCHTERVEKASAHTRHKPKSAGSRCTACHMPARTADGMTRTDHSLRPPLPSATAAFTSPNACTQCHADRSTAWAEKKVIAWHGDACQAPYLRAAGLIQAARRKDWSRLPAMLAYIENPGRNEIIATSLIRYVRECPGGSKWPVLIQCVKTDPSPLVRAAAAGSLKGSPMGDTAAVLFAALSDRSALVRIRAVSMLAMLSVQSLMAEYRPGFEKALREYTAMLSARPDDPASSCNLGNLYLERREYGRALAMYQKSLKLDPDNFNARYNSGLALYNTGDPAAAEQAVRTALQLQPNNSDAHMTLGILLLEQKRPSKADAAFRAAIKCNPGNAAAYYNLSVMNAEEKPKNSLIWARKAYEIEPKSFKYGYTYAYYLNRAGQTEAAVDVLKKMIDLQVPHPETYALLADIYLQRQDTRRAKDVYRRALDNTAMPQKTRMGFLQELQKLK